MTLPNDPREPWDDRRLAAAFAARARSVRTPSDLVDAAMGRVRASDPPQPVWRRWLPAAAVIVLAMGVVAGGVALSDDVRGRALFRPGPTADLKTLDTGEFTFDYPASWLAYDASVSFSGGSATAVLGTLPVERQCGDERHVDINCVYKQRLEPGHVRLYVGTGTYRGGTIQDRPNIDGTTRVEVGGMPAILAEANGSPDSYYGEDKSLHWEIARPGTNGTSVVELEALLTDPGLAEARERLEALVASFRFTTGPDPSTPPTPEPTATATPPRLADLRVMTVEELIAAAESPTPEEVVVRGWLARSSTIFTCQIELDPHPLISSCEDFGLSLSDDRVPIEPGIRSSVPHVVPKVGVDAHSAVPILPGTAVEVLAMGHLLDHRWTTCPLEAQDECKRRFVIDRVVPDDQQLAEDIPKPWTSPSDRPVGGVTDALDVLSSVVGGVTVLSIGVADMEPLRSIEPQVDDINNGEGAWVIRILVAGDTLPVPRTFLVGHIGWWTVFEVTESGVVDLVGKPAPEPPTDVLGLPVLPVDEAMAIRDAGRDDREIAVRGWVPPLRSVRCRAPDPPLSFFLEPDCQSAFSVMTSTRQVIVASPPDGDFISVALDEIVWQPGRPDVFGQIRATEAVLVGHFDDRRSGWCHASRIEACRDRFVVDRVEWADGVTQGTSLAIHADNPVDVLARVQAIVTAAAVDGPILSASVRPGSEVGQIEPALRDERPGITDQAAIWVVRVLEDGRAVSYLVVDGTDRVYRVERDGQTVQVGGRPPTDPETWPPTGVVDVPMPENTIGVVAKAGVVDRTGLLVEARAAGEADPRRPTGDLQAGQMFIVQAAPDTVVAYWDGSLCDDRFVLTVYGDRAGVPPDRLELRGEEADLCRLALVHRGIVLRFSQPVDATAIHGWERVGTPFEAFPPVDSTVVLLPKGGGFELPRVRAALVDLSGRIKVVRLPRADEPRPDDEREGPGALVPDPSVAGRYHLMWNGGICTSDIVVTIDATLSNVVVSNPVPGNCDTVGNEYRLVLDIEGRLDPPAVEVDYAETSAGAS